MGRRVVSVRHYRAGYETRTEEVPAEGTELTEGGRTFLMKSAYTPDGHYIGRSRWAYRLAHKYGVVPELAAPGANVCSVGFSERKQKWYGWSHRAIYGFGIGDVVKEGDLCATTGWIDGYVEEHPEADKSLPVGFMATTLDDARLMAVAFAEAVG